MQDSLDNSTSVELTIVNVFTRLIIGGEQQWGDQELSIMQALREADRHVYLDSNREMGIYLHALGVQEMIELVTRVKNQLQQGAHFPLGVTAPKRSVGAHR